MNSSFALLLFFGLNLFMPLLVYGSSSYEVQYDFVDAVVVRRMIPGVPQFDRAEILGTAELYKDGVSNALLGQYDVTVDVENSDAKIAFENCLTLAREAMKSNRGLIIRGSSSQPLNGGYKTLVFLETVEGCEMRTVR